jgi:hypothetical protein
VGGAYSDLKDKRRAITYFEQALPLYEQVEDKVGQVTTLSNLAGLYKAIGEQRTSNTFAQRAKALGKKVKDEAKRAKRDARKKDRAR